MAKLDSWLDWTAVGWSGLGILSDEDSQVHGDWLWQRQHRHWGVPQAIILQLSWRECEGVSIQAHSWAVGMFYPIADSDHRCPKSGTPAHQHHHHIPPMDQIETARRSVCQSIAGLSQPDWDDLLGIECRGWWGIGSCHALHCRTNPSVQTTTEPILPVQRCHTQQDRQSAAAREESDWLRWFREGRLLHRDLRWDSPS